jgi:nitrous oxide reductase accessory protein NosL
MSALKQFPQILVFSCLFLFLAACKPKTAEIHPPNITYGQDICDRCGMIIGEAHFAAATQLGNGDYLKFDDAGEMFAYHAANPTEKVLAWWVHDYYTEEWIAGETAFYVKSDSLSTPMGTGIACFANEADAKQFAVEQGGKVYSFVEIQ